MTNDNHLTRLFILMTTLLSLSMAGILTTSLPATLPSPATGPATVSFYLSYSPANITREITSSVKLTCKHDGVTKSRFSHISQIHIMRKTDSGGWEAVFNTPSQNCSTFTNLVGNDLKRTISSDVNSTYMTVEWAVADKDMFTTYRCDLFGVDHSGAPYSESTLETDLPETLPNTYELLHLLRETQQELSTIKAAVETWPSGNYALLQPATGCPVNPMFADGTGNFFAFHTESTSGQANQDSASDILPLWSQLHTGEGNFLTFWFCQASSEISHTKEWPSGSYCISKVVDKDCPGGFAEGSLRVDVEDTNPKEKKRGSFGNPLTFCCRDGDSMNKIQLPTASPFLLYRRGGRCQEVQGMSVAEATVTMDTEDSQNNDETTNKVPDVMTKTDVSGAPIVFYLCYYTKE